MEIGFLDHNPGIEAIWSPCSTSSYREGTKTTLSPGMGYSLWIFTQSIFKRLFNCPWSFHVINLLPEESLDVQIFAFNFCNKLHWYFAFYFIHFNQLWNWCISGLFRPEETKYLFTCPQVNICICFVILW